MQKKVVILGTGGTIAGTGSNPEQSWQYKAAQLSVRDLVSAVPALASVALEVIQVAQIDSKDMGWSTWQALGAALQAQLVREDVSGVVITHGTDTLEETAYLLHCLSDGSKPIVLTAAMRPATAPDADGPRNLLDAVAVVQEASGRALGGVVAVLQGKVWAGCQLRKAHSSALDAFDGGGHPPLALLDDSGAWLEARSTWPRAGAKGWQVLSVVVPPRVELITSHADADGWMVEAALAFARQKGPLKGLLVAGTGHGTLHKGLEAALAHARAQGVTVWRSSKVARGGVLSRAGDVFAASGDLTPSQARLALVLHLLGV